MFTIADHGMVIKSVSVPAFGVKAGYLR